jgi:hypothetical protein
MARMAEKRAGRTSGRKASVETETKPSSPAKGAARGSASSGAGGEATTPAAATEGPRTPGMAWIERMREYRGRRERDVGIAVQVGSLERQFRDRQREVGDLIDAWIEIAPAKLRESVSIGGLTQGTLTLVTASSAAGYEASRALRDGLERALMQRFPARVRRVKVKVGGDAE